MFIHIRLNPSFGCLVTQSLRSFCSYLQPAPFFTALSNLALVANTVTGTEIPQGICAAVCTRARSCKSVHTLKPALLRVTACGPVTEGLMVFSPVCSIHQIWAYGRISPWGMLQEIENMEEGLD